ncbi:UDP-glucose/GDP-mannose dehydrogenase family protein [Halomonas aquamarina]|uniref:UDP-glucose/GDP-mannose dehydrogenase family protein n=1 Tax=Vreelandella aquamarina TaxID=77097 RepID=A0ACC5VSJ5_9GAMM|nr:UDP-glucose/GDP-mannose dehydrogenase family protein [Halomonas aquamarina]MBZ5486853.1 UDP-glucose/GDP-mannose dehydrogenase family protein [Halomonas aquamarina]
MKITIFGCGYVGLVTGACLADVGHEVICVDVNENTVSALKAGQVPIYEPGLERLILDNLAAGRLNFTTDAPEAVKFGLLQFIAVGTPSDEDGSADLKYVLKVAETIGQHMNEYKIIVDKSTVPVGTAEKVERAVADELEKRGVAFDFDVCSNPEFLKEGAAIEDFSRGSRIIVGTESERVREAMRQCYGPYNRQRDKLMFMGVRSAELTKYAANALLATKISFINEVANLAEHLGAEIEEVRHGIGSDPRIGYSFIYPGCGYGGSCFPKDVRALANTADEIGQPAHIIKAVERVNDRQKNKLFEKLSEAFDGQLAGKTIALWGLAFKPGTDDMREAPSRALMEALWGAGAQVQAFDPEASNECRRLYGERDDLVLAEQREDTLEGAHALVICTEWKAFRTVDFSALSKTLLEPIIVDGRNLFHPDTVKAAGLAYYAIGRGDSVRSVQA